MSLILPVRFDLVIVCLSLLELLVFVAELREGLDLFISLVLLR